MDRKLFFILSAFGLISALIALIYLPIEMMVAMIMTIVVVAVLFQRRKNLVSVVISILYLIVIALSIHYWDLLTWLWSVSGQILVDASVFVAGFVKGIFSLDPKAILIALIGFVWLIVKTLYFWLAASIAGGVKRIFTIVPGKKILAFAYNKSGRVKNFVKKVIDKSRITLERIVAWYKQIDLFDQVYSALIIFPFIVVILLLLLFGQAIKYIIANKAGEILVEKVIMFFITRFPIESWKPQLIKIFYDPIHKTLEWVENKSRQSKKDLEEVLIT